MREGHKRVLMAIRFDEVAAEPTGDDAPSAYRFSMQVVIQTDTRIDRPRLIVRFNGRIGFAAAAMPGRGPLQNSQSVKHADAFEVSFGAPPLTPNDALYVFVWSENPVRVERVEEVRQT